MLTLTLPATPPGIQSLVLSIAASRLQGERISVETEAFIVTLFRTEGRSLVRLARRLGDEPVTPKGGLEAPRRGWLPIPTAAPVFVAKMPLMIAQHPDGTPLKLAVDTESVIAVNAVGNRVRYATNTEAGSSGSPVFDFDWNLVALHHLGDPAYDHPPTYNQGVPIDRIRARLTKTPAAAAALG